MTLSCPTAGNWINGLVLRGAACFLLVWSQSGCSERPLTTQNRLRIFLESVSQLDPAHITSREALFASIKKRLALERGCVSGFGTSLCAKSQRYEGDECLFRLNGPLNDDGRPDKFVLTFECFLLAKVDWAGELTASLGPSSGVTDEDDVARVVKGGILSLRSAANEVQYRSPALTGDPLDFREEKSAPRVPLSSMALFYLNHTGVSQRDANIWVAELNKPPNPFDWPLQSQILGLWLSAPSAKTDGINILYLKPQREEQTRMNGLIVHFVARRPFDAGEISDRLEAILTNTGFENSGAVLKALALTLEPTSPTGEVKRVGNFIVARHYESNERGSLQWYSIAVVRRVLLPPEELRVRE